MIRIGHPHDINDLIFPNTEARESCEAFVKGILPGLIFYGVPGTGKSSAAEAMMRSRVPDLVPNDLVTMNAAGTSTHQDIERFFSMLRNWGQNSQGLMCGIMDEVHGLSSKAAEALKACWDETQKIMGGIPPIIFTTNHLNKVESAMVNRVDTVEWHPAPKDILIPWIENQLKKHNKVMTKGDINALIASKKGSIRPIIRRLEVFLNS